MAGILHSLLLGMPEAVQPWVKTAAIWQLWVTSVRWVSVKPGLYQYPHYSWCYLAPLIAVPVELLNQSTRLVSLFDVQCQELAEKLCFLFSWRTIYSGWVKCGFHCWQGIAMYLYIEFLSGAIVKHQDQVLLCIHVKMLKHHQSIIVHLCEITWMIDDHLREIRWDKREIRWGSIYFVEAVLMLYFFSCVDPSQLSKRKKKL